MKDKQNVNDEGFSLLEMVVALGLLSILTMGGMVAVNSMNENMRQSMVEDAVNLVMPIAKTKVQDTNDEREPILKAQDAIDMYNEDNEISSVEVSAKFDENDCLIIEAKHMKNNNLKHSETVCNIIPLEPIIPEPVITPPTPPVEYKGEEGVLNNPELDGNYRSWLAFSLVNFADDNSGELELDNVSYVLKDQTTGAIIDEGSEDNVRVPYDGSYYIDIRFWQDYQLYTVEEDGNTYVKFSDLVLTIIVNGESKDYHIQGNDTRIYYTNNDPERLGLYGELGNYYFDDYYNIGTGEFLSWKDYDFSNEE